MTEETEAPESPEPQVASLEDVIAEANQSFSQPAPTPAAPTEPGPSQTVEPVVPMTFDPLDDASVRNYAQATAQGQSALQSQVQELNAKLTQYEQSTATAKVEADIRSAVTKVTSEVDGLDPVMAEVYLEKRAREEPGFQSIWNNRDKNPGAYNKALGAIANELKGRFDFKADPQLAENHRAANQSQQQSETTQAPQYNNTSEERLANAKSPAEWASEWAKVKSGG